MTDPAFIRQINMRVQITKQHLEEIYQTAAKANQEGVKIPEYKIKHLENSLEALTKDLRDFNEG